MKQLRIEIDEETDAALEALAASARTPKEAILRHMLAGGVRHATVHDHRPTGRGALPERAREALAVRRWANPVRVSGSYIERQHRDDQLRRAVL